MIRLFLTALCCVGAFNWAAGADRPSFLLLLTDDQSYHLGMTGEQGLNTPNIDALAARGCFFRKAYSTAASCAPCRGSILTGMFPSSNGHWRNTVGPHPGLPASEFTRASTHVDKVGVHEDIVTLPELLKKHGYMTGITAKFHLSPPWKFPFDFIDPAGLAPTQQRKAVKAFFELVREKPFFLQVNVDNTHRPFRKHIEAAGLPEIDPASVRVPPNWPDTELTRQDYAEYLTTVQHADTVIGAVLEELHKAGRAESTYVIYTSDQGFCYHRAKASAYEWGVHVPLSFTGPGIIAARQNDQLVSHIDIMPTVLEWAGIEVPESVQGRSLVALLTGRQKTLSRKYMVSEHNAHGPGPTEYYPTRSVTDGRFRYIMNLRHDIVPSYPIERFVTDRDFAESPKGLAWMPWDATPGTRWQNNAFAEIIAHKDEFPVQYDLLKATFFRAPEELYDLLNDPYEMQNIVEEAEFQQDRQRLRRVLNAWMRLRGDHGDPRAVPRRE